MGLVPSGAILYILLSLGRVHKEAVQRDVLLCAAIPGHLSGHQQTSS